MRALRRCHACGVMFGMSKKCPKCHPLGWWRLIDVGLFVGIVAFLRFAA